MKTLLGSHHENDGNRYSFITSQYAAVELAMKSGPEVIRAIASAIRGYLNPVLRGCLFKMLFFANISVGKLELSTEDNIVQITCFSSTV